MSQSVGKPRARAQLWNGSAWVDAPGDATNGLKVQGPLTDTQLRASAVPVSAASLPLPSGAAQEHSTAASPSSVRLSDGAAFLDPRDVSDRSGRLLGHVTVDNASVAVTGPLTDTQLRATAVPVSMATQTPDVTDRAAREVGRVRVWDGTDEATVLPVRTQPATTEKALIVNDLPTRLPTYAATIPTQTPAITIGVKNLLDIWHPNTVTQDVYIVELWASVLITTASTAGRTTVRVSTITSAPTGGTNITPSDVGGAGASALGATGNVMQVKTAGGAVGSTFIRKQVEFATNPVGMIQIPIFSASPVGNGIILRGGAASGICVDIEREVAHSALVDTWTVGARWVEL